MFCLHVNMTSILDIFWPIEYDRRQEEQTVSDFRLCNRLKVARAEKSLSQEQLALLAGVTRQTISSIETGQYNPSALLALVLARRLDKRVEDLFFWRKSHEYRTKRESRRADSGCHVSRQRMGSQLSSPSHSL